MVVSEAQRTSTYFHLFGYPMDLVVANRVLPAEVNDPYFTAWKDTQARYMQRIHEGFSPVPILTAPLFNDEIVGLDKLGRLARSLYGDGDPAAIFYEGKPQRVEPRAAGGFELSLPLPFATKGDVQLRQTGDELFVHVGAHRRHIILPRALVGLTATGAKLDEQSAVLRVYFEPSRP
jgi:arsenite/tail-anchored protein-transporting ATPase